MPFWLSWYHKEDYGEFELHSPWWFSGMRVWDGADTVCAAVRAQSEHEAKMIVMEAYDKIPTGIEWRFCLRLREDWTPFSDRFPKAEWMQW